MSAIAKVYIAAVLLAGYGLLGYVCFTGPDLLLGRLALSLALVLLASPLKVALPGVPGTLSVNYMVTLLATNYLTLPGTLLVAGAGSLTQCVWRTKNPPDALRTLLALPARCFRQGPVTFCFTTPQFGRSAKMLRCFILQPA